MRVLAPDATLTIEELRAHLMRHAEAGTISRYAVPDELAVLTELPCTSVGKIDKRALRTMLTAKEQALSA